MDNDIIRKAKQKVKDKKDFYWHLIVFAIFGLIFFLLNMLFRPGRIWFHIPMILWGIAVLIHYFSVFGFFGIELFSKDWEKRELEKEIDKLATKKTSPEEEDTLDLNQPLKRKEKQWDEKDIV